MVNHHPDHSLFDSNISTMLRAVTCVTILYVEWSKGGEVGFSKNGRSMCKGSVVGCGAEGDRPQW